MPNAARKIDLSSIAQRLNAARANARERRRFRRLPLVIGGRMLDCEGREHDCRTADISPGDARIASVTAPDVGQRVVIYLEGLGRVSGKVARRCGEGEIAVISISARTSAKSWPSSSPSPLTKTWASRPSR
ncbi:MAG TPA: PilZ domain-containing protein [Terricaulis sp.]|nr:PilZ domain-containing protein [Terricaulis sp.]